MAYKNKEDKRDNSMLKRKVTKLNFYRRMGLEPRDINNPQSTLVCYTCGRESHRSCPNRFRHEKDCLYRDLSLKILGITEDDLVWSRKPRKHPVQLSMGI